MIYTVIQHLIFITKTWLSSVRMLLYLSLGPALCIEFITVFHKALESRFTDVDLLPATHNCLAFIVSSKEEIIQCKKFMAVH